MYENVEFKSFHNRLNKALLCYYDLDMVLIDFFPDECIITGVNNSMTTAYAVNVNLDEFEEYKVTEHHRVLADTEYLNTFKELDSVGSWVVERTDNVIESLKPCNVHIDYGGGLFEDLDDITGNVRFKHHSTVVSPYLLKQVLRPCQDEGVSFCFEEMRLYFKYDVGFGRVAGVLAGMLPDSSHVVLDLDNYRDDGYE